MTLRPKYYFVVFRWFWAYRIPKSTEFIQTCIIIRYDSETVLWETSSLQEEHVFWGVASCNWVDIYTVVSEEPVAFLLKKETSL